MRAAPLLAALALAGCGGANASKEIETLHSWRATIDLTAEAQLRGWVTPRYARDLSRQGEKAVSHGDDLLFSDRADPAEVDSLAAAAAALRAALGRLHRTGR